MKMRCALALSVLSLAAYADDFQAALSQAYAHSPLLKAEHEQLGILDAGVSRAGSGYRPDISAGYETGPSRIRYNRQGWSTGTTGAARLTIDQPLIRLDVLGTYRAAQNRMEAGQADLRGLEQNVLLAAVEAYADLAQRHAVHALYEKNVHRLATHLAAEEARYQAGAITRTDIYQAQTRLAQGQAALVKAAGEVSASLATYQRVIGTAPAVTPTLPPLPHALPPSLDNALTLALAANPQMQAAGLSHAAAKKDLRARRAALLPTLSLRASALRSRTLADANNINRTDEDSLLFNLHIPLYRRGTEYADMEEASHRARQTMHEAEDTRQSVEEEITTLWARYHAAAAALSSLILTAQNANAALSGTEEELKAGTRTTLDLLDAEQEALTATVELVRGQKEVILYAYRLQAALGALSLGAPAPSQLSQTQPQ